MPHTANFNFQLSTFNFQLFPLASFLFIYSLLFNSFVKTKPTTKMAVVPNTIVR